MVMLVRRVTNEDGWKEEDAMEEDNVTNLSFISRSTLIAV